MAALLKVKHVQTQFKTEKQPNINEQELIKGILYNRHSHLTWENYMKKVQTKMSEVNMLKVFF
jgi:hypothetical protein